MALMSVWRKPAAWRRGEMAKKEASAKKWRISTAYAIGEEAIRGELWLAMAAIMKSCRKYQ
jgi:hypothetical protein